MRCTADNLHSHTIRSVKAYVSALLFAKPLTCDGQAHKIRHSGACHNRAIVLCVKPKKLFHQLDRLTFQLWRDGIIASAGILIERTYEPVSSNRGWCRPSCDESKIPRTSCGRSQGRVVFVKKIERSLRTHSFFRKL